jgi:hypothetical protein
MPTGCPNPFDSLESSHEYIALLCEALAEARTTIGEELALAETAGPGRRVEALQLVSYKLTQLDDHLRASRRILNDLRLLRRIIEGSTRTAPDQHGVASVLSAQAAAPVVSST